MYLTDLDIVAISIALVSLMALVVTSACANARLTRERNEWRNHALFIASKVDDIAQRSESER
jgi:hypothetical protein